MANSRLLLVGGLGGALVLGLTAPALAQFDVEGLAKKAAGKAAGTANDAVRGKAEKDVNAKLLAEGRKNQCSFKSDSDQLVPGCDAKLKNLASALVRAKSQLDTAGVHSFKFEVTGHTDTAGKADHNKELSEKRAQAIVKELIARGIPNGEIIAVGKGSEQPLVKPDNTPAKKAKNRRYDIQLRL
jgi:OOP family OmpA-OmpF porin